MDPQRFDTLVKSLATSGTRRAVLRLLSTLSLGMALTSVLDDAPAVSATDDDHGSSHRRQRRKAKHRHQTGNNKDNRKGERKGKRKGKGKGKSKRPSPQATCTPSCPPCQRCDQVTRTCVADPSQNRTVCAGTAPNNAVCCNGVCWDGCCGDGGAPGPCVVFVTADPMFQGDLGGLTGADEICRTRAMAGTLPGAAIAGNYKAWLSTGNGTGQNPLTRFRHAQQPYVLPDAGSTQVADDWTDLITCEGNQCLDHGIDVTESGPLDIFSFGTVWTNTTTGGTEVVGSSADCLEWTSNNDVPDFGHIGKAGVGAIQWTHSGLEAVCNQSARLYCFQQA